MFGPYIHGLGQRPPRKRKTSESASEESEKFFSEDDEIPRKRRRRVTPSDAELIPKFHPDEKTSNVTGWLHKIDQLGEIYGWRSTDRQYVMQIRLRGSARDWYDDLEDYNLTWEEWKEALQTAFPRSTDYADRLERMISRIKNDSETMTKYYHEKLSLLKKCEISGENAISCIIRGLPAELRANVKAYKCDSPEELYYGYLSSMENFKRVEANHNRETTTTRKSTWRRFNSSASTSTGSTSQQEQQQKQPLPKICYSCRRPGHEAKDCRSQQRCEICRRFGHTPSSCWFASSSAPPTMRQSSGVAAAPGEKGNVGRGSRPVQDGRVLAPPTSSTTTSLART